MSIDFNILTSPHEFEDVREFWQARTQAPNQDYAQFIEICRTRPTVEKPLVITARCDGQLAGLVVGRLERVPLPLTIGYLSLAAPAVRTVTLLHDGSIGDWTQPMAAGLAAFVPQIFASTHALMIRLGWLREDHALVAALREQSSTLWRDGPDRQKHWKMSIPAAAGDLLGKRMKSKHRGWIRRKIQDLEHKHPGSVKWQIVRGGDITPLFPQMESVAALSYQRALGAGFMDSPEFRWILGHFAASGSLRICLLSVDGKLAGYWIGVVIADTFHSMYTAYDPNYRSDELGTQIFVRMVDALADEHVEHFDFGLGDAFYKQRFGDQQWLDATLTLFRPSARGLLYRCMVGSTRAQRRAARWAVERLGMLQSLKTRWRRRKQKKLRPDDAAHDPQDPSPGKPGTRGPIEG